MEERQTDFTIMEGYELPSRGKIYDVPVNSHVELRSMTARDEMKRLSPSTTPLKTLADIIEGCMIEKPAIHVYDMALGDYEYLLHKLRVVTYGPEYKISTRCPECGNLIETTANLDSLETKEFNLEKFEDLKEFTLPKSGKRVKLKMITPRMLDEIDNKVKDMERKHKGAGFDFETLIKLTTSIDTIDNEKCSITELETLINNMPAADMACILNNMDKLNQCLGLDTRLYITCPKCGEDFMNFFRFGPEFFRPTNI